MFTKTDAETILDRASVVFQTSHNGDVQEGVILVVKELLLPDIYDESDSDIALEIVRRALSLEV